MSSDQDNLRIFDDPDLQAALKRACPPVSAPLSLRLRVNQTIEQAPEYAIPTPAVAASTGTGIASWFASGRHLAIAAAVGGLVLGMGLYLMTTGSPTAVEPLAANAGSVPVAIQNAVTNHDELGGSLQSGDERVRSALYSAPQMRDELRQERAITLPAIDLSPLGWDFVGAKKCPRNSCCVAQLFFRRGPQSLSVFVLDDQAVTPGMRLNFRGHQVALRKIDNGVVGVVGSAGRDGMSQTEVDRIADLFANK